MKRVAVALLSALAAGAPLALPHVGHADTKVVVTFDCGSAGTVEIAGFPNSATAEPVVNSTQYRSFVGHEYWEYDSAGSLVYWFADGSQGSIPGLVTCTSQQDGVTVVVLAQLL